MSAFEACGGQLERLEWAQSCRSGLLSAKNAFDEVQPFPAILFPDLQWRTVAKNAALRPAPAPPGGIPSWFYMQAQRVVKNQYPPELLPDWSRDLRFMMAPRLKISFLSSEHCLKRAVVHVPSDAAASGWIKQRVDLERLTTWLGHASVQTTLDVYGHLVKDAKGDAEIAAAAFAELLA